MGVGPPPQKTWIEEKPSPMQCSVYTGPCPSPRLQLLPGLHQPGQLGRCRLGGGGLGGGGGGTATCTCMPVERGPGLSTIVAERL